MGRFITVNVQCDWTDCEVIAPEGEGIVVPKTLSIDGKQAREFLVCKNHLDRFEEIVLPLMQAGVKVETPNGRGRAKSGGTSVTSSPTPVPVDENGAVHPTLVCKVPDCDRHGRPLSNRTGMAQHVIRSHGYESLAAYEAQYGTVVSIPRKSPDPAPTT